MCMLRTIQRFKELIENLLFQKYRFVWSLYLGTTIRPINKVPKSRNFNTLASIAPPIFSYKNKFVV